VGERQCEFCWCRTNARLRACCEPGRRIDAADVEADTLRERLAEAEERARIATETHRATLAGLGEHREARAEAEAERDHFAAALATRKATAEDLVARLAAAEARVDDVTRGAQHALDLVTAKLVEAEAREQAAIARAEQFRNDALEATTASARACGERDAAIREREEARDWVRKMHRDQQVLTCVYCGHAYPPGTPASGTEALTAHVSECPKHPLAAAIKRAEAAERRANELDKGLSIAEASCRADSADLEEALRLLRDYSEEREPYSLIEWEESVRAYLARHPTGG
jgi:hypothetical protein